MTVWKFPLAVEDHQEVQMPSGAKPLKVMLQNSQPCLWVLVDPSQPMKSYHVWTYGTGHVIDEGANGYVDSYMLADGQLVFHVFVD